MENKNFKVGDILFGVDVADPANYLLHEVEITSFTLTDDEKNCGWNVKCEILSDDIFNGAVFMTHTDRIFETRKEALEYILKILNEKQIDASTIDKAQKELQEEEERLEKRRIIEEHAALIRKRLSKLNDTIVELFKDPLIDFMFEEVEENSQFTCALDIVIDVLSYELTRNKRGWDKLIKEIFNSKEKED